MKYFSSPLFRIFLFFLILDAVACSPLWSVEYFINQDGSGHLYSSYLMLQLIKGNPVITQTFAFNSLSVPNSSGHWLMVLLLNFFQPFVVTKIIVTLTFAGFVASIGWLRWKTVGLDGLKTSLLFGTAIGFNWLWFLGFYNFIIGVCGFTLSLGLFYKWRECLNWQRALLLSILLLLVYFSHLVSFAILAGSIGLLTISSAENLKKNIFWLLAAFLPVIPLAIIYKSVSIGGGGFFPVWRNLENPLSVISWFSQIRTADPFILISRRSFPFLSANSDLFAIFTPFLWIIVSIFSLSFAGFRQKGNYLFTKNIYIFTTLFAGSILAAMFAPDDFGLTNGSILRERILLCGLIFFVPIFRTGNSIKLKRFAQFALGFVVLFQTAAIWEYSLKTNAEAKEFISAKPYISENDPLASVVILEDGLRFHSLPMTQFNNYLGFVQNSIVWDNYEGGHFLFPIVAKDPSDKQFILDLTSSNVFSINNPGTNFDEKLAKLDKLFSNNPGKIKTLVLWGKNSRVEEVLSKWFEPQPFFENEHLRLFHSK